MNTMLWTAAAFVTRIIPKAQKELDYWLTRTRRISCPELREQAVASIVYKRFHVLGGSVYALYPRREAGQFGSHVLRAITAIQTISDYLDNLCDRAGVSDERGFRQLHVAMSDALESGPLSANRQPGQSEGASTPYYLYYPHSEDSGYLAELVRTCKASLASLPGYQLVKARALDLASLYCDLQSLKHLDRSTRRRRLCDWAMSHKERWLIAQPRDSLDGLEWWEFAAATGSTLDLFSLFALAASGETDRDTVDRVLDAYFPWVCGLHILLDYLIDLEEDEMHGDLNFVSCYRDVRHRRQRLTLFVREAASRVQALPRPEFHLMVVRGLLALYLSDPKVRAVGLDEEARALCGSAGWMAPLMRLSCTGLRRLGVF